MVPEDLAGEYRFVESLDDANAVRLVESVATREQYVLKLLDRSSLADDRFHQQLQLRSRTAGESSEYPGSNGQHGRRTILHCDRLPPGRLAVFPASQTDAPLPREAIRPLIRDLATACRQMHDEREGCRIIHGDIKPSNVLVVTPWKPRSRLGIQAVGFRFCDFAGQQRPSECSGGAHRGIRRAGSPAIRYPPGHSHGLLVHGHVAAYQSARPASPLEICLTIK